MILVETLLKKVRKKLKEDINNIFLVKRLKPLLPKVTEAFLMVQTINYGYCRII